MVGRVQLGKDQPGDGRVGVLEEPLQEELPDAFAEEMKLLLRHVPHDVEGSGELVDGGVLDDPLVVEGAVMKGSESGKNMEFQTNFISN